MLTTAGGLVLALAVVPRAPLHAQLESMQQDSKFILAAASSNLLEVRLGNLAQSKATNPSVKQFGQQMVTDHSNLENQLSSIVAKNGTAFNPRMNDDDEKELDRLEKLSGTEFDRQYMTAMIQHHQKDVAAFQSQASSARSAEARQIASTGLPVLQRHLTLAQQIGAQVGATGGVAVATPTPTTPTTPTAPSQNPPVATQPGATTNQTAQSEINADMTFIRHAGSANQMEIQLGQVAQSRASNSAVKQFGQRMVDDHTRMQNQLTAVVTNTGVSYQPTLEFRHQQLASRIQRLSGAEFDRAYMQAMIQAHQEDVQQFQTQSQSARSTQIRNLSSSSLPVLQQHLSLAVQVGSQVGADTNDIANRPDRQDGGDRRTVVSDAEFIRDVGADNTMMVELAKLAQDRAKDRQVREFADRLQLDHQRIQDQWNAMTQRQGIPFKPGMGPRHREKIERLKDVKGKNFDRAYMTLMIQQHQDEVSYWQKEGRASRSPQVRNLVDRGLPTLEQDLAESKRIGRRVGVDPERALRDRTDIARDRNKDKD
jgi:putative membrane protein